MAKLPCVLVLTGDNSEIERFLKSLVSNGLVENTLRSYSSSKIDLSILEELVLSLQKANEEVERLTDEIEQLKNNTEKEEEINRSMAANEQLRDNAKKEIGALKDKLREADGGLKAAKGANELFEKDVARLKDMLNKVVDCNLGISDMLRKEVADLIAEV